MLQCKTFTRLPKMVTSSLNWFGREKGHFFIALGADGAPFGKANEACSWLVLLLNVVGKVASPDHNFLICSANCKEDHPSMIEHAKHLKKQNLQCKRPRS